MQVAKKREQELFFPQGKPKICQNYRLNFFNLCLRRRFSSCELPRNCGLCRLIAWNGNLIRGSSQGVHLCMSRLDKQTPIFHNHLVDFCYHSLNHFHYLYNIAERFYCGEILHYKLCGPMEPEIAYGMIFPEKYTCLS